MAAMTYAFVALSAVVPSLLLMWYFHRRDVFREPARDLWTVFALGFLIVLPVLAVARPLEPYIDAISEPLRYGLASAFFQAAIPEEVFKFLVLGLAARRAAFDEPMDGVIYGVAASLGFATLENIVYVANSGFAVALTRAFTAVPSHAFLGAIMGYYVGLATFDRHRRGALLGLALAIPILLHGLYDWPLLAAARVSGEGAGERPLILALLSIAPLVVVAAWILSLRLSRRLRIAQLERLPVGDRPFGPTRAERLSTVALAVGGGIVASLGSVMTFGGSWIVVAGSMKGEPVTQGLAVLSVLGLTPTLIGVALFLWGVRRLRDGRALAASVGVGEPARHEGRERVSARRPGVKRPQG